MKKVLLNKQMNLGNLKDSGILDRIEREINDKK